MIRKPNFKLNWKYALGEVVLIFIGISLAVGFQNWNAQSQKHREKLVFLERIKSDLQEDKLNLEGAIQYHIDYDSVLDNVQMGTTGALRGFGSLNATIAPRLTTTSFQIYSSSGNLEFLNNELGISIQSHYLEYEEWEKYLNYFNTTIEQDLRDKFDDFAITEASVLRMQESKDIRQVFDVKHLEKITSDIDIHRIFGQLRFSSRKCRQSYEAGVKEIEALILKIDQELKK